MKWLVRAEGIKRDREFYIIDADSIQSAMNMADRRSKTDFPNGAEIELRPMSYEVQQC